MSDNIIGKPHKDYVQNQIEVRQEILGRKNKSSSDIVWANGRSSWIRLASSVDIEDEDILKYNTNSNTWDIISNSGSEFRTKFLNLNPDSYGGNELAKTQILEGGILYNNESSNAKFGVSNTNTTSPNNTSNYGYGGTEFGLKPMPGITSFSSNTYNNGSLRKATITIKAHNKSQFKYIESVYLRLGYTMLLEWGNSSSPYKEDGIIKYDRIVRYSLADDFIKNSYSNPEDYFYGKIEEFREKSQGNYDAFFAKVENFSWEFNSNGEYLITLILISIGSVIDSLKLNTLNNDIIEGIIAGIFKNDSIKEEDKGEEEKTSFIEKNALLNLIEAATQQPPISLQSSAVRHFPLNDDTLDSVISCFARFGGVKPIRYLRFKTLLQIINDNFILKDENNNSILFRIDTSETQFCFSNGISISSDPSKIIIPFKGKPSDSFEKIDIFSSGENKIPDFHTTLPDSDVKVGNIMNLFFSFDFLESVISSNIDEETGDLYLSKFLKPLINEANNLLGGVNKIQYGLNIKRIPKESRKKLDYFNLTNDIFVNQQVQQSVSIQDQTSFQLSTPIISPESIQPLSAEEIEAAAALREELGIEAIDDTESDNASNTPLSEEELEYELVQVLEFYDEVLPFGFNPPKPISTFNIYGFNPTIGTNQGSFVTNFGLKTELSKKTSNMIAVGAQANSQAIGVDGTLFSKWNVGLVDRHFPKKLDIDNAKKKIQQQNTKDIELIVAYKDYCKLFSKFTISGGDYEFPDINLSTVGGETNNIKGFIETQKAIFQKFYALDAIQKNSSTPFVGFLPINFHMDFDGLSGIRIFDRLSVNSRFLPSNYGESLDFIITELDHKIENNKWVTTVGTQSIPKMFDNKGKPIVLDLNLEGIIEDLALSLDESESSQGLVGSKEYIYSPLAKALDNSYFLPNPTKNNYNIRGEYFLENPGPKNIRQKSKRYSPMVNIGKQGGVLSPLSDIFKTPNIRLLNQSGKWGQIYKDQYNSYYNLMKPAAIALQQLAWGAELMGISFTISSAYRNEAHNNEVGGSYEISAHKYGGAIDISELWVAADRGQTTPSINARVRETSNLYKWLEKYAPNFGWYNPYRYRNGQGTDECWHWEFWGVPGESYELPNTYDQNKKPITITIPTLKQSEDLSVIGFTPKRL